MSIKFDGTYVKRGSTIIGNFKRKDELREGSSSGGNCLGNVKRTDEIREGSSSGGKCLCNIKRRSKTNGRLKANAPKWGTNERLENGKIYL